LAFGHFGRSHLAFFGQREALLAPGVVGLHADEPLVLEQLKMG